MIRFGQGSESRVRAGPAIKLVLVAQHQVCLPFIRTALQCEVVALEFVIAIGQAAVALRPCERECGAPAGTCRGAPGEVQRLVLQIVVADTDQKAAAIDNPCGRIGDRRDVRIEARRRIVDAGKDVRQ